MAILPIVVVDKVSKIFLVSFKLVPRKYFDESKCARFPDKYFNKSKCAKYGEKSFNESKMG